jgi:hypothetical protein
MQPARKFLSTMFALTIFVSAAQLSALSQKMQIGPVHLLAQGIFSDAQRDSVL